MKKTYTVARGTDGTVRATVQEQENGGRLHAYNLRHCVYHSPTGFETGYGGSGPADLALSILADYFEVTPSQIDRANRKIGLDDEPADNALRLHQNFKFYMIAPRNIENGEQYSITSDDIDAWIKSRVY